MNTFLTLEHPDGLISPVFIGIIKTCIAKLLTVVISNDMDLEDVGCYCFTNYPCERVQTTYPVPRYYVFTHFNEFFKILWTERFLPGIMHVLETRGIITTASRVQGVCEVFLNDLRLDIAADIMGDDVTHHTVMNELVPFWINSPTHKVLKYRRQPQWVEI